MGARAPTTCTVPEKHRSNSSRARATCAGDVTTTRVRHPRVPGSAARVARKRLRGKGFHAVDPPMDFWVDGVDGPLQEGELERARSWGAELVTARLVG